MNSFRVYLKWRAEHPVIAGWMDKVDAETVSAVERLLRAAIEGDEAVIDAAKRALFGGPKAGEKP